MTAEGALPRPMNVAKAPRRLKILFLYSRPPLPMTRGDELTVAHLLEFLHARGHIVDFVTLFEPGHYLLPEHEAWLRSRCHSVSLIEHSVKRHLFHGMRAWFSGQPFQIGLLLSPYQLALAQEMVGIRDYDLAYAYYIRSAEALRAVRRARPKLPTFMALQLSQTLNTGRLAKTAPKWWELLFYHFESRFMEAYEARLWQDFSHTVLIGEQDRAAIVRACNNQCQPIIDNVIWGPHGVDIERFKPQPDAEEPDTVVMTGVMRYAPNVEAALWFAQEIWPLVRQRRPQARLFLVGREPVAAVRALDCKNGITVTGTVKDPADWIARATVCVAPIRAAAGLQNKLLEAMAMAKAVVATPMANEGIGAVDGGELLLAEHPDQFAKSVANLLDDPVDRKGIGHTARKFIEDRWTWEALFLQLEQEFLTSTMVAQSRDRLVVR